MSATRFPRSRSGLYAITASLMLLLPLTAGAAGATIWVAPPNGTNDTANIQAALDACVAQGPGCTVQLQAGRYLSRQLVAYNFRGTLKGMGKYNTIIEALPYLPVTFDSTQPCQPNTSTCLWPTFIIFVDGDIRILDLSVHMFATEGTAIVPTGAILDGIRVMGQYRTNLYIDHVDVEGRPDDTTGIGYNVLNGIAYAGELNSSSANPIEVPCGAVGGFYFLSGSYTVRNSTFKSMYDGVGQDGCVRSSHITIGGSPSTGNTFEDHYVGIDMESAENSVVQISYNVSSATYSSMWVVPWFPSVFEPSKPSQYFIHDNKLFTTGQSADAILLWDNPPSLFIDAVVWNNAVELQDSLSEGIDGVYTKGARVLNNSIAGSDALDAIGFFSGTLDIVTNNRVSGVTIDGTVGFAQIVLDGSLFGVTDTSDSTVVCRTSTDTVLNLGTNNRIIRCQLIATPEATTQGVAPAISPARPNLPIKKPHLPW